MKQDSAPGDILEGEKAGRSGAGAGPGRPAAPRAGTRCDSAVAPVDWFRGEAALRTYLAQRDQCLELYRRGRAEGLYGCAGAGGMSAE